MTDKNPETMLTIEEGCVEFGVVRAEVMEEIKYERIPYTYKSGPTGYRIKRRDFADLAARIYEAGKGARHHNAKGD